MQKIKNKKKQMTFKERVERGLIGERIFYEALLRQIIPNLGFIRIFPVIEGIGKEHDDSRQYNLVNGDLAFLALNREETYVDVKCNDKISLHCLDNLKDGAWIFVNAFPSKDTTGLPFMFKIDWWVKKWIKENCEPGFYEDTKKPYYRILKHQLTSFIPEHYEYKFDVAAFCKHRSDCLVKLGILLP